MRKASVILVSLPWTSLTEPSLGLGILKSCLEEKGIECRVMHLNLFLLEHLKATTYYSLANVFALNDFIFSGVLDPTLSNKQEQWLRLKTKELLYFNLIDKNINGGYEGIIEKILHLRNTVIPDWLEQWADEISKSAATLIGLTCMFDQTIASVALSHLIKKKANDKLIALGGYAVRSPTGEAILRAFSCVDVVCNGEGEPAIEKLTAASAGNIPLREVPNIIYRDAENSIIHSFQAPLTDMNSIPVPNYDDYFKDVAVLQRMHNVAIETDRLPIENSRGCWWGQTKHCVFCGINDEDLRYRFRSSEKVLHNLDTLHKKYGYTTFRFSDYILPHAYYKTLLPALSKRGKPYRITSELKANLSSEQFRLLKDAGFDEVQPGIESFSNKVLQQMDKGVSAIQNVYTLILGKQSDIPIRYNILYGLPNDDYDEVLKITTLLPKLFHLDPPSTRLQIQITRYAPLQTNPERFGISASAYEPSYDLIFSSSFLEASGFNLNEFCYYFERPFENPPSLAKLYREIDLLVDHWQHLQEERTVSFYFEEIEKRLRITDSRKDISPDIYYLTKMESLVYKKILNPTSLPILMKELAFAMPETTFSEILLSFQERGLVFTEGEKIIGLALPMQNAEDTPAAVVSPAKEALVS